MSASQGDDVDLTQLQASLNALYLATGVSAMYCYDCLISFDQEIKHIWSPKWTLSTWIFVINRYATLVDNLIALPNRTSSTCSVLTYLDHTLQLAAAIVSALFTGLRAYALCNRAIWVFSLVFGLGMVNFVANLVIDVRANLKFFSAYPVNICGLFTTPPFSAAALLGLSLATRISLIVADLLVLVVTWKRAAGTMREAARAKIRVPLSEVLIRDGTFFFLALLVINIYMILDTNIPAVDNAAPIDIIVTPLNSIIISRFMLNLRQVTERPGQSVDIPPQSTIQFTSGTFVGNMGQSLSFEETNIDDVGVICECEHPAAGNQGDGFQASGNAAEPYPGGAIESITPGFRTA